MEGGAGENDLADDVATGEEDEEADDHRHGEAPELGRDRADGGGAAEGEDGPERGEPGGEAEGGDGGDDLPGGGAEDQNFEPGRDGLGEEAGNQRAGEADLLVAPALVGRRAEDRVVDDAVAELRQAGDGVGGEEEGAAVGALGDADDVDLAARKADAVGRALVAGQRRRVDRRHPHQHVLERAEGGAAGLGAERRRRLGEVEELVGAGEDGAHARLAGEARVGLVGGEGGVELAAEGAEASRCRAGWWCRAARAARRTAPRRREGRGGARGRGGAVSRPRRRSRDMGCLRSPDRAVVSRRRAEGNYWVGTAALRLAMVTVSA